MDSSVAPAMIIDGHKETKPVSTRQRSSRGGWNAAVFIICKLLFLSISISISISFFFFFLFLILEI